jgi:hypothetical protein
MLQTPVRREPKAIRPRRNAHSIRGEERATTSFLEKSSFSYTLSLHANAVELTGKVIP